MTTNILKQFYWLNTQTNNNADESYSFDFGDAKTRVFETFVFSTEDSAFYEGGQAVTSGGAQDDLFARVSPSSRLSTAAESVIEKGNPLVLTKQHLNAVVNQGASTDWMIFGTYWEVPDDHYLVTNNLLATAAGTESGGYNTVLTAPSSPQTYLIKSVRVIERDGNSHTGHIAFLEGTNQTRVSDNFTLNGNGVDMVQDGPVALRPGISLQLFQSAAFPVSYYITYSVLEG